MKLMDMVNAHIASEAMNEQILPYDLALALVKVKKQTRDEAIFFAEKERELVMEYAAQDENGNIRLTQNKTFIFKDPSKSLEYERRRRDLADTDAGEKPIPIKVKAPEKIAPLHIEALEGFIEFLEEI